MREAVRDAIRDFSLMLGGGEPMTDRSAGGPDRLVFGTVVRAAPIEEGGELVVLDWKNKRVEARTPIKPQRPTIGEDPNPRGNGRGCRGIRWWNGRIVAASYHTLEIYDAELNLRDEINDGLMVGLHEIERTDRNTILATSTSIDAVVEYDLETQERVRAFWPRETRELQDELGLTPLEIDKNADNRLRFLEPSSVDSDSHLHLNAVDVHEDIVYALCNDHGCIVNLTDGEVTVRHDGLEGAHNLRITGDGTALVNDTWGRAVRFYDLRTGNLLRTIDLTRYRWVRKLMRWKTPPYWGRELARKIGLREHSIARPLFVRGLVKQGPNLFVGLSPAAILQIDYRSEELIDAYQYSTDVNECIHGLEIIP